MSDNRSEGLNFTDALTLLFIGLKLSHIIDWSWWLVLMPMIVHFVGLAAIGTWAYWFISSRIKKASNRPTHKIYKFGK